MTGRKPSRYGLLSIGRRLHAVKAESCAGGAGTPGSGEPCVHVATVLMDRTKVTCYAVCPSSTPNITMNALARAGNEERARRKQARRAFMSSLPQDERDARNDGTFFADMDRVWQLERVSITNLDCFNAIVRTEEQGNHLYSQIVDDDILSHPMSQSEASSVTNTVQQSGSRFDMFQNDLAEKAHLGFSDASECHKAYGYLAQAAIGKQVDDPGQRMKILNGVKPAESSRRSHGTGLKHHKLNKMYLERQGDYFYRNPILLTIPILRLDEVLDWNGTDEYDVLAITVGDEDGISCSEKVLKAAPGACDEGQVRMATELLRVYYAAIACSVRNHDVGEAFTAEQLDFNAAPVTNLKKWWKLKKEVLEGKDATIQVPKLKDNLNWDVVKVARARASRNNSLPDPYNMAIKAAVNFSAILGAKVMPACPTLSSDLDEEINSSQDEDKQWPHKPRQLDPSSLLRPTQAVVGG